MNIRTQKRITAIVSYTVLIIWSLILFFPMYWVVITSFKTGKDMAAGATYLPWVDFQPSLNAWRYLLVERLSWFMQPFMNSVIVAFTSSLIALVVGILIGLWLTFWPGQKADNRFGPA